MPFDGPGGLYGDPPRSNAPRQRDFTFWLVSLYVALAGVLATLLLVALVVALLYNAFGTGDPCSALIACTVAPGLWLTFQPVRLGLWPPYSSLEEVQLPDQGG